MRNDFLKNFDFFRQGQRIRAQKAMARLRGNKSEMERIKKRTNRKIEEQWLIKRRQNRMI